jgi:hypothetical protein
VFKINWVDYLILTAAMVVFLYSVFTIETVEIRDPYENETVIGKGMKIGVQLIIAPIIILHRVFLIVCGPTTPRLKELDWKLKKALFFSSIHDKIEEGKTLTREYLERNKK